MTRHDLSIHLERKQASTTAQLREELGNKQVEPFAPGAWVNTRAGDVVLITSKTWMSIYGTLWKQYASGNWHCYGSRAWRHDGRYYDASLDSLEDLTKRIPQPHWIEGQVA